MRVLTVIVTADRVEPRCWDAATRQTHADGSVLVYQRWPAIEHPNAVQRLYRNCAAARDAARKVALASDADAFLFLDSDVVLPPTAVATFVDRSEPDHVAGGYYPIRDDLYGRYPAGVWGGHDLFVNLECIWPGRMRVDVIGCGCAFVPRVVLAQLHFRHGCDETCVGVPGFGTLLLGECGAFGRDARDKGFALFMDGDVVCEHVGRPAAV